MNTKMLIAGILGGITYFLSGWLFYDTLFGSTLASMAGSATGVMRPNNEMLLWAIALGNLSFGVVLAYIFSNWAKVSTLQGGLTAGATIGGLLAAGMDFSWYSTTNIYTLPGMLLDIVIFTTMSALAGAVIGWWLGRSNA